MDSAYRSSVVLNVGYSNHSVENTYSEYFDKELPKDKHDTS